MTIEQPKTDSVKQDIANYVLANQQVLQDIPAIKSFVSAHIKSSKKIAELNKRLNRLSKAKSHFEPVEAKFLDSQAMLKKVEADLLKLHRPIGERAFAALIAGEIASQPCFENRNKLNQRIAKLRVESESLAPNLGDGLVQKSKAKAQQIALMGKVKLEEMKISNSEQEIGKFLIETKSESSIRCDTTEPLLKDLAMLRKQLESSSAEHETARSHREKTIAKLVEAIPVEAIESMKTIDVEIKKCEREIAESIRLTKKLESDLLKELAASETELPMQLKEQVALLQSVSSKSDAEEEGTTGGMLIMLVMMLLLAYFFKWGLIILVPVIAYMIANLNTNTSKIGWSIAAVACLIMGLYFPAHIAAKHKADVAEQYEAAGLLWADGKYAESSAGYQELLDELNYLGEREAAIVLGRLIDNEIENGTRPETLELIARASDLGVNPQIESNAARDLFREEAEKRNRAIAAKKAEARSKELAKESEAAEAERLKRLNSGNPADMFDAVRYDEIISATTLHNKFGGNEVSANEAFKGEAIFIDGEVAKVESGGFLGSPTIVIEDGVGHFIVMCELSTGAGNSADLKRIRNGSFIRVWGKCAGKKTSGRVQMTDCEFDIQSE